MKNYFWQLSKKKKRTFQIFRKGFPSHILRQWGLAFRLEHRRIKGDQKKKKKKSTQD